MWGEDGFVVDAVVIMAVPGIGEMGRGAGSWKA